MIWKKSSGGTPRCAHERILNSGRHLAEMSLVILSRARSWLRRRDSKRDVYDVVLAAVVVLPIRG